MALGVVRIDGTPVYGTTSEIDGAALNGDRWRARVRVCAYFLQIGACAWGACRLKACASGRDACLRQSWAAISRLAAIRAAPGWFAFHIAGSISFALWRCLEYWAQKSYLSNFHFSCFGPIPEKAVSVKSRYPRRLA